MTQISSLPVPILKYQYLESRIRDCAFLKIMPHSIIYFRVEGAECGGLEDQCTQTDDEDMDIEEERIPLSNNGFNGKCYILAYTSYLSYYF